MADASVCIDCGVCQKRVTERQNGLNCEGFCHKWFHSSCVGITKSEYKVLSDLGDRNLWFCEECKNDMY